MTARERLLKNINIVKAKEGLTDELADKVCNLYIFDKISDDDFMDIIGDESEEETEEGEE